MPYSTGESLYSQTIISQGSNLTSSTISTISTTNLQNVIIDYYFSTVSAGTFTIFINGIEPQSGNQTSVINSGQAFIAPSGANGQRIICQGPMGGNVAIYGSISSGGTVGTLYMTVQQSKGY